MVTIIVLATNNKNKVKEFQHILKDFKVEIRSLSDFGPIPEAIEDGDSFDENAYIKAHHTARVLGLPAIADDSGLVVEALGGAPGVHSARYAGENSTDKENTLKLLQEIKKHKNRKAFFKCVLSIAVPSGPALTYEGECHGKIVDTPRGENGFGYDPVFYFEEYEKTFAELTMDEKSKISHRGKALSEFQTEIDKVLRWLDLRIEEEKPPHPDHSQFENNDWSKE
ncbi:MAG: XTP/dITP diphosphatase [Bacteroidetes bacterium]|nr:XTP/dITP diphosphatase [Bacteroidota bacterium]